VVPTPWLNGGPITLANDTYRRANRLALVRNFIDTTKRIAAEANARDS
jgi:hypothetical protein